MQALKWLLLSGTLLVSGAALASDSGSTGVLHYETLQDLGIRNLSTTSDPQSATTGATVLTFTALGRTYELQLEPNDRLLSSAEARNASSRGIRFYRGKIAGNADSWVRIVMHNEEPQGLIWDGTELLAIEAPGDSRVATTEPVIFRMADTLSDSDPMSCAVTQATGEDVRAYESLVDELNATLDPSSLATSQISVSAIGDVLFSNSISGDPALAIAIRLNNVDGIFSDQVGVQIVLEETEIFSAQGSDPFSNTTAAQTLLNELGQYREANANHSSRGLTHLFTGRNLDGSTAGTGYSSLICWDHFGSGLTQATRGAATDSLIAAHEIGHNFGAPHDGSPPCGGVPATFLMAPTLSNSDQFSSCSLQQMQPIIAAAACITAIPSSDVSITAIPPSSPVLLGNIATVIFDVRNVGSDPATNVAADIILPSNATFVSATASSGNCTNGAGTVTCQVASIAGGSTNTLTLITTMTAVGTANYDAAVTADADDNAANNQASTQVTVDPAVDLIISVPSTITLLVGQSGTANVAIENASDLNATGVSLAVTIDAGISANSATWAAGSCTVAGQTIDCQASSLASRSSATLSIEFSAGSAGMKNYDITLSATEADRNTTNNNISGTISVSSPPTNNGGGGGGSTGLWILCLLLWMSYLQRRAVYLTNC
jgi:uncharacterized repeat protein (TIGR01451 family)